MGVNLPSLPPVDLKTVVGLVFLLLKQLGELVVDRMKGRTRQWWNNVTRCASSTLAWQTKYVWTLIILAACVLGGVYSVPVPEFGVLHQFTAYDCERPILVQALKLPSHCLAQKTMDDSTDPTTDLTMTDDKSYQLLQKAAYHEFEAHRCVQTRSRFFYSCVWASHSIVNVIPQTGRQIVTRLDFCVQAIRTKMFTTESGALVPLNADGQTTYIPETVKGDINVGANGFVSCNGEDVRHHRRVLKQTVILQETHFAVKKVKIRRNFDSRELMIVETGTTIPEHLTKPGGFAIDSGTYVIPKIDIPCAYQLIKPFLGTANPTSAMDGMVITSQVDQVHIHTHGPLNPPPRCPIQGNYRKTGHPDIVVFQGLQGPIAPESGFDPIDARQVSIPNMVTLKVEWALYKTSRKFGLVHDISRQAECSELNRLTDGGQDRPELQGATESLLYAKGEMLYNVQCPRIEVGLDLTTNDDRCYKYLPVVVRQTGRPATRRFLIPGSRLLSNVSETEPCEAADRVPRGYLTTKRHWLAACP